MKLLVDGQNWVQRKQVWGLFVRNNIKFIPLMGVKLQYQTSKTGTGLIYKKMKNCQTDTNENVM